MACAGLAERFRQSYLEKSTGKIWFKKLFLGRGTSILGEVRNEEISGATQQLLCSKSHDFLTVFALAHSKVNQIA